MITPNGAEIYYDPEYKYDPVSGGQLDKDKIPEKMGIYVENIYFPLDGSAPRGQYEYFVENFSPEKDADEWELSLFLGDDLTERHHGVTVGKGERSPIFKCTF